MTARISRSTWHCMNELARYSLWFQYSWFPDPKIHGSSHELLKNFRNLPNPAGNQKLIWMGFIENLVALFSSWHEDTESIRKVPEQSSSMENSAAPAASSRVNSNSSAARKRVAQKLKGYFDLAKEEISKAVSAEEWGLPADAMAHYRNAQSILTEAMSAQVTLDSSRDSEEITKYLGKIAKWQGKVAERLQVLSRRSGVTSSSQNVATPIQSRIKKSPGPAKQTAAGGKLASPKKNISRRYGPTDLGGTSQAHQVDVKGVDPKLVEMIENTIVDRSPAVKWEDVAGLAKAKQALLEMVILPTKRSDLFTGLRKPARGLLLFGPPGNGKTMLAKAVASESAATFFSISASSLTSKWVGEAEKLMRALFAVAVARQPSIIFIDEIDSIMSARSSAEHEVSRRLKSEFLIQFDGVMVNQNDRVIIMGATNRPHELDDAVLRRLVKRIYVPLPDENVRRVLLRHQLKGQAFSLPGAELERLVKETDGYSGSDLQALCEEAAMMPIRELGPYISSIKAEQVRALTYSDFKEAMMVIRPSVPKHKLQELEQWNEEFGSR